MPKVIVVSSQLPDPIDSGKRVILSGLCRYFREGDGNSLCWVVVGSNLKDGTEIFDDGVVFKHFSGPSSFKKVVNVVVFSLILRRMSIQEAVFSSSNVESKVHEFICSFGPDVVVFDTVRVGRYLKGGQGFRSVLYLDDLFSVRYSRMLAVIKSGVDLGAATLGNFRQYLPSFATVFFDKISFVQRYLLAFEMRLISRSEVQVSKMFDAALLLNDDEVRVLASRGIRHVKVMRPWLQTDGIVAERMYAASKRFVFLGALNIPHNEVGLLEFLQKGAESFFAKHPDSELLVVGKSPTARLQAEISRFSNVKLLGYVENLDSLLGECCGMIVPLIFGSGVKLKMLEALCRGVPVVSTDFGVEGIPMVHGRDCFVENDVSKFGVWMEKLIDPVENARISEGALRLFQTEYSVSAVRRNYGSLFFA